MKEEPVWTINHWPIAAKTRAAGKVHGDFWILINRFSNQRLEMILLEKLSDPFLILTLVLFFPTPLKEQHVSFQDGIRDWRALCVEKNFKFSFFD